MASQSSSFIGTKSARISGEAEEILRGEEGGNTGPAGKW
jgi:hypothetical protein